MTKITSDTLDLSEFDDPFEEKLYKVLKSGRHRAVAYHGTSTEYFWSIVTEGFTFSEDRKNWENVTEGVYFAFSPEAADMYAHKGAKELGGDEIIFVLDLPMASLERDIDDAEKWDKDRNLQGMVREAVKPKNITGVIYPVTSDNYYHPTPIRKFLQDIKKGSIEAIPDQGSVKTRFRTQTPAGWRQAVLEHLKSLSNYTDHFDEVAMRGRRFNRKAMEWLASKELHDLQNYKGKEWVQALEEIFGYKDTKDYVKTQDEYNWPLRVIVKRYANP